MGISTKTTPTGAQKARKQPQELTPEQLVNSLTISVGEARKILGVEASERSDMDISNEILKMTEIAHLLLSNSYFPIKTV
jgi:hypothetical protein